jgi:hypothetical protein
VIPGSASKPSTPSGLRSASGAVAVHHGCDRAAPPLRVFRRRRYLTDKYAVDPRWFTPSGAEIPAENWADPRSPKRRVIHRWCNGSRCHRPRRCGARRRLPQLRQREVGAQISADVSARGWEVVCATFDRVPLAELGASANPCDSSNHSESVTRERDRIPSSRLLGNDRCEVSARVRDTRTPPVDAPDDADDVAAT